MVCIRRTKEGRDLGMDKYYILCVSGQSNAVGYDESLIPADYTPSLSDERIRQLGLYGEDNLRIIPLGACAQNFQDLRPYGHPESAEKGTRGIHLPLAKLLLPLIPRDAVLLVLPCAYGGTGFTEGETGEYDTEGLRPAEGRWRWGINSPYYLAMRDRIAHILSLNEENRFFRMVWCQGEQDKEDPEGNREGFERMTEDFFAWFQSRFPGRVYLGDWDRDIWFNLETTRSWYTLPGCRRIWDAYRAWDPSTYIAIPRETDTNAVNGTGRTAANRDHHFGNNAYARVIAPLAADRIISAVKEK